MSFSVHLFIISAASICHTNLLLHELHGSSYNAEIPSCALTCAHTHSTYKIKLKEYSAEVKSSFNQSNLAGSTF